MEKKQLISNEQFENIKKYIDDIKELLSADIWESIFLNFTKNEILVFWLLYQKKEVNMTEIAEYIHVPLNTATGIVNRMEKNDLIIRNRSTVDKRVVLIELSQKGNEHFEKLLFTITHYGIKVMNALTKEEMELFAKMTGKVLEVLREEKIKEKTKTGIKKINID
ncbi:MAG: MarR family transcriptional regulator [Lachnospiraceae bacterium]|nr:MarR family transcriptional regulator [Lachnospiraceae bacterium]